MFKEVIKKLLEAESEADLFQSLENKPLKGSFLHSKSQNGHNLFLIGLVFFYLERNNARAIALLFGIKNKLISKFYSEENNQRGTYGPFSRMDCIRILSQSYKKETT